MPEVDAQLIKKSRPPARVLQGEDFPITRDGVVYYPHAGETVRFIGESSDGFIQDIVRLGYLLALATKEQGGMLSIVDGKDLDLLFDRVRLELVDHIEQWTWTDSVGRKLPKHPGLEDLRKLALADFLGLAYASIPEDTIAPAQNTE